MVRLGCLRALACALALAIAAPAKAQPALEPLDQAVCRLIERAAHGNSLPVGFMTRVIWRESSFRSAAISPMGAEGIAQFMPGTAAERGVRDPFDPEEAIPKAARLLAELKQQFGNLGLAAAAYNAGPARVASWLHGEGGLPAETRLYVRLVTEKSAEDWLAPSPARAGPGPTMPDGAASAPPVEETCVAVASDLRHESGTGPGDDISGAPLAPWGVQLAGNFSKGLALAQFARAEHRYAGILGEARPMIIGRLLRSRGTRRFYQVRLPAPTRAAAAALCGRILAAGGACVAMRS